MLRLEHEKGVLCPEYLKIPLYHLHSLRYLLMYLESMVWAGFGIDWHTVLAVGYELIIFSSCCCVFGNAARHLQFSHTVDEVAQAIQQTKSLLLTGIVHIAVLDIIYILNFWIAGQSIQ